MTRKDELIDQKKFMEIKQRTVLQENLKTLPKVELLDLASRRDILPWTERYKVVKTNLKTSEFLRWREQLLHLGKKSLKLEEDKMATKYSQDLKSFEEYINSNYLLNVDVLNYLFSQIKRKSSPKS